MDIIFPCLLSLSSPLLSASPSSFPASLVPPHPMGVSDGDHSHVTALSISLHSCTLVDSSSRLQA